MCLFVVCVCCVCVFVVGVSCVVRWFVVLLVVG